MCVILTLFLSSMALAGQPEESPAGPAQETGHAPGNRKLVWADEFDYQGLPEATKWDYEVGMIRNREAQYYVKAREKNTRVENGNLIIEAHKEPFERAQYSSGSLRSKADWKYGRIEVRAKIPTGRGMWPAIWMLPSDRSDRWPACGEIDIMENVGFDPDTILGTVHTKSYNHTIGTQKGDKIKAEKPYEGFHVYAIEWDEEKIDFYFDDTKYFTFKNEGTGKNEWPFDKPFHVKLNIAVGGSWGGMKGIDDGIFPQQMVIDYVRVYQ
jgi:beta-glucanase (GH16 family)